MSTPEGEPISSDDTARLREHLESLYPPDQAEYALERCVSMLEEFAAAHPKLRTDGQPERVDETDVVLITYGDQIQEPAAPPLQTLDEVLTEQAGDVLTGVHILPFFPYSSDDGFSVIDYTEIDPDLGTWEHVEQLSKHFRLMADFVCNHISAQSEWFSRFKAGEDPYIDYFITVPPDTDLSNVVRPRALPLLTEVETVDGPKHVWTTFSEDQIDLNYATPDLLLDMTGVLLEYVHHGAELIRMDAIAYLWKEIGTSCIHLPETHEVVKFWRTVFDIVAPHVLIVTETNVPHEENVSYFGNGHDEAQMVYQFPLPPLTLHAFHTGDAGVLTEWAAGLDTPSSETTFFNFLASHDGIGVRPAEGLLTPDEVQALIDRTKAHGGNVSYKTNPDGSKSPYELNINYYDALNDPHAAEPLSLQVDRFITSQAILLSMAGVPGIYVHSFFGSRGWPDGVEQTGRYRTINRRRFPRDELERELADEGSRRHQIYTRYSDLIRARASSPAFHPTGAQQMVGENPALFSFIRRAPDGTSWVLCIHNVSDTEQSLNVSLSEIDVDVSAGDTLTDLITGEQVTVAPDEHVRITVPAYGVYWFSRAVSDENRPMSSAV